MYKNEDHNFMFSAFIQALTQDGCNLACLDVVDNKDGSEKLVLAMVIEETEDIIPLAVFFDPAKDSFSKRYTLLSGEMQFIEDAEVFDDREGCNGNCPCSEEVDSSDENFQTYQINV